MKKILTVFLAALLLLAGCSANDESTEQAIVWSALSTEKFRRDEKPEEYSAAKLNFTGMKGETQSAQLMITANEYVKGFSLETSDLSGESGTFSKNNVKVYAERYVDIYMPYENPATRGKSTFAESGFYPDALVPIDSYKKRREDRIEKGNNQGIWVDVEIPSDAKAGIYEGKFILTLGEKEEKYDIPVTLNVYDLSLPEEVHSRTHIAIWYETIAIGEGDNYDGNTDEVYYNYLLSKRVCSAVLPTKYSYNMATYIEYISKIAQDPKVTAYVIPTALIASDWQYKITPTSKTGDNSPETVAAAKERLKNGMVNQLSAILDKNLEMREAGNENIDLLKKAIYYFEDEPTSGWRTQRVRVFCEQLRIAKNEIAEKYKEQFAKYPDLLASLEYVQEICPSNHVNDNLFVPVSEETGLPDYEKSDGLTLWCPEEYKWKDKSFRDTVKQRQEYGERFWWYNCCQTSPSMSYYVEALPINIRSYSWMQYQYGIEGILYWQTTAWESLPDYNPYEDLIYSSYGGGEGILLYPGAQYGQKQPISSIRLQQLFAGQQDYEYFYMLDNYLTANEITTKAADLIYKLNYGVIYDDSYTLETADPYVLEENRVKILDILDSFAKSNVTEAKNLINEILK